MSHRDRDHPQTSVNATVGQDVGDGGPSKPQIPVNAAALAASSSSLLLLLTQVGIPLARGHQLGLQKSR